MKSMKKTNILVAAVMITLFASGCGQTVSQPTPVKSSSPSPAISSANPLTNTQLTTINNSDGKDYNPDIAKDPSFKTATLNKPVDLKFNDTAQINSELLEVKFTGVEDSRCPADVQCITAGMVKIKLALSKADTHVGDVELVMIPGKNESAEVKFDIYTIKLNNVKPDSKKTTQTITDSDYSISLTVSK